MSRVERRGARLTLPRDLQVAYVIGRFGLTTMCHISPLFWGAPSTARAGFLRLTKLDIIRSFPRSDPSRPKWFSLTKEGAAWVAAEADCEPGELRLFSGIGRVNLAALTMRNRFWTSLILASRKHASVKLATFQPEWELRQAASPGQHVVPDALVTLTNRREPAGSDTYLIEFDSGSERSRVWVDKAEQYRRLRDAGALYGVRDYQVLALVPSVRRAHTVAKAVVAGGAGAFTLLGVEDTIGAGRALERCLYLANSLASHPDTPPSAALGDPLAGIIGGRS